MVRISLGLIVSAAFLCSGLFNEVFGAVVVAPGNRGIKPRTRNVKNWLDAINAINMGKKSNRVMYLNQGVEFVFPLGVHYILANVNEQLWNVPITGFETVMEFPRNKIAVMFSSMVNTLKLANFSSYSTIYTKDNVRETQALRILGTDIKSADFVNNYIQSWERINKDIATQTNGKIDKFVPKGGFYGKAIYPFTKATFINTIQYKNEWAASWRNSGNASFSDAENVPFLEHTGLMPFYENEAFSAVAVLFKGGTGSVVFLKPKSQVSILQLMLNPNALTEIFDESFPGWGVKTMKIKVPTVAFTTNTQHYDTLIKRGVSDSFCNYDFKTNKRGTHEHFLNPIVQTNHIEINKYYFEMVSATGATLNSEKEFEKFTSQQDSTELDEHAIYDSPSEREGTTQKFDDDNNIEVSATRSPSVEAEVESDESVETATEQSKSDSDSKERNDLSKISFGQPVASASQKFEKKGGSVDEYNFDEPFLWFLHATNEEPMFMGIIESLTRYKKETATKSPSKNPTWLGDTATGILWNCP